MPDCRAPFERLAPMRSQWGHWVTGHFCRDHIEQARAEAARIKVDELRNGNERMRGWTLDTFPADDLVGRRALRAAREWLDEYHESNLLLYGPVGSGKTGLAWSLLIALLQRSPAHEVRFVNVRQLLAGVRRTFDRRSPADDEQPVDLVEDAINAGYLVLDDVGAERATDWAREKLAEIVERRYVAMAQTIVTSNYPPSALARRLGHDDPVIGLRIVSRLTDGATQIRLDRPDLRARPPVDEDADW
jgi:DNA replication protein DnaC